MDATVEDTQLPEGWVKCFSKSQSGMVYFFNTLTGESLWEHPEAVLLNEKNKGHATTAAVTISKKEEESLTNHNSTASRKRNRNERKLKPLSKSKSGNNFKKGAKGDQMEVKVMKKTETLKARIVLNTDRERSDKGPLSLNFHRSNSVDGCHTDISTSQVSTKSKEWQFTMDNAKHGRLEVERGGLANHGRDKVSDYNSNNVVNANGSLITQNRSSEKKTLKPLKPLKTQNPRSTNNTENNFKNSSYRIPKKKPISTPKTPVGKFTPFTGDNFNAERNVSPTKNESRRSIDRKDSSKSLRSPGSISGRSSSSWSTSDIAMTGPLEAECDSEPLKDRTVEPAEEEMEIDDAGFMTKKIFKQIESIRLDKIEIPRTADSTVRDPVKVMDGSLFIVLDTNILLSHLKFVSELKDSPIPGAGRPTVVIPWMVVQELDRLKNAPDSRIVEAGEGENQPFISINFLARNAVAFIHNCFSQNHPRIKGQSVFEASKSVDGFTEETNDDSILCCCLLLKQNAPQTKTVLLSNDRNLCSKALMNGVKAFTKKTLLPGLQDLFQSGNIIVHKGHFKEYFKEAEIQERISEQQKKADNLICELQCILREALAAIVEQEMKEVYGEIWLAIVKIKPPWTLIDTFELLEKHWIAVFGQIVNRNLKEKVTELKKKFLGGEDTTRDLNLAGGMIELGFAICDTFAKHSGYDGVLSKCLAAAIVLRRTYKKYVSTVAAIPSRNEDEEPTRKRRPLPEPSDGGTVSDSVSAVLHQGQEGSNERQLEDAKPPHFAVMITFDEIWKAVRMLSSSIFRSMEYPNPYQEDDENINLRPSKEESLRFLQQFVPCLGRLVQGIQRVLACSQEDSVKNPDIFVELGESIAQFLKSIMCRDCKITLDELCAFCMDNLCRNALVQGMSQLDRALAMLQHCQTLAAKQP
ncbi:transcriptional protein SWT1-like isoform X2 [Rhopilema esculentum]|uniref:transcriptional protein SWT1-like isoform X2 n=1 Tax=Rhopilema esculentum TaxID=499914 RepID=UPI0031E30A00